jgi:hypothetical protein
LKRARSALSISLSVSLSLSIASLSLVALCDSLRSSLALVVIAWGVLDENTCSDPFCL